MRTDGAFGPQPLIFTHNGLNGGDPTFSASAMTNLNYDPGGPSAGFNGDGKLDVFFEEFRTVLGQGDVSPMLMQNVGASGNWLEVKDFVLGIAQRLGFLRKLQLQ